MPQLSLLAAARPEASARPSGTQPDTSTAAGGHHTSYAVLLLKIHQSLGLFAFFLVFQVDFFFFLGTIVNNVVVELNRKTAS